MATVNNKKKQKDQVSSERKLVEAVNAFSTYHGEDLTWLKAHLTHFIEERRSMKFNEEKLEFRLVEPVAGAEIIVLNETELNKRYPDGFNFEPDESLTNPPCEDTRYYIRPVRPVMGSKFRYLDSKDFFKIPLVIFFRSFLQNLVNDAKKHDMSVIYGVGHANMVVIETPRQSRIAFAF